MSNSDSDVDFDIQVPKDVRVKGRARRGPASPAPTKKKAIAKPLVVNNKRKDDYDDDEQDTSSSSPARPKKGRKRPSDPKWSDELDNSDLLLDSDEEAGPSRKGENQQNRPPQHVNGQGLKMTVVDSDEDDDDEGSEAPGSTRKPANPRLRKRLSVRRQGSIKSSTTATGTEVVPTPDPDTLKKIYASCIDLFQSHKITMDNAFQIRFLELMGDIIDLPEFDKHDMLGAGRMLEAGAKIYVCRVDKTKLSVMDLASTLNMQMRNKKRNETDTDHEGGDQEGGDVSGNGEEVQPVVKKKRKKKIKENQCVIEDISKISLSIEVDSCKGGARRAALKTKFQDFIENDIDFDYFTEYLSKVGPEVRPDSTEDVETDFGNEKLVVSTAVINIAEFGNLQHLKFLLLEDFDKKTYDVWGKRHDQEMEVPENYQSALHPDAGPDLMQPEGEAEHAYVPLEQPPQDYNEVGEVADNLEDDRGFNDTFVNDEGMIEGTQEPASSARKLSSLQDFFDLYQKVKSSFGWCGPTFVKHQRFTTIVGTRKPRTKKDLVFIDIKNVDRKAHNNRFLIVKSAKGVFDERNIERWSSKGRPAHPYLELDEPGEEFEEVLELINDNDEEKPEIPNLFKFFIDLRRNLLNSLTVAPVKDEDKFVLEMNKVEDDYIHDAGFEVERHYDDDFVNDAPMDLHDADIPRTGETGAPFDSSFNFPICLSNLLMESEHDPTQKTDMESVRFTKKPKPIDMHALKRAILEHLKDSLQFHSDGQPYLDTETTTDFLSLLKYVLNTVDIRTAEHMSISILAVGLLHVVVEKKLFVLKNPVEPINPLIVCRGKQWIHAENIPMPILDDDLD